MLLIRSLLMMLISVKLVRSFDDARPITLTYSVVEEQPVGTQLGDLVVDTGLSAAINHSVVSQIYFSILPGKYNEYFDVDAGSCLLYVARQIDRDDVCYTHSTSICRLTIDIALLRPVALFRAFQVHVDVLDVNDNDPKFNVEDFVISVPESVSPGTFYILPEAYDVDAEPYSVVKYQLMETATTSRDDVTSADEVLPFRLESVRRDDSSFDVRLVVTGTLDRELVQSYSCRLLAIDGGQPPRSATLHVAIVVGDVNDHSPRFDRDLFTVTIPEDFPLGVPFIQVTATDEDDGINGQVRYATVAHGGGRGVGSDNPLTVDRSTGQLSLRRSLDYEQDRTHVTIVAAHDAGPASITAYARVIVHVTDVNDHFPNIRVHATGNSDDDVIAGNKDCDAEVGENQLPGTYVAQISVVDVDSGDNGRTQCSLMIDTDASTLTANRSSVSEFTLQRVHATMFTVSTAAVLDRETVDVYRMSVACVDGGQPALDAVSPLTVCVADSNDNAPAFDAAYYSVSIPEDAAVGTVVLRVTATDKDLRQNGEVRYHIRPSSNDDDDDDAVRRLLAIDGRDGSVMTTGALDYENQTQFDFVIVASDRGRPRLSTVVPVTVSVYDVNDKGPRFTKPTYEFETYENEPVGTEVGVVSVSDADSSPYNRFQLYVLNVANSPETEDAFSVDMRTGRLVTLVPLDRELRSVYRLTVVARDDHPPHFTSTANVTVRVLDRNDNAPLVAVADAGHVVGVLAFHVSAQSSAGDLVGIIQAADADSGTNARLHWSIAGGDDQQLFFLDEHTGHLSLAPHTDLSVIDVDRFQVSVLVSDDGLPPKSTFVEVDIEVVNRTSSVELLLWTNRIRLSTKATVVIVITLAAGLLVLFLLLLVACCLRRSKVIRRSRRGRRSTDIVCPSPRVITSVEAGTLPVRGRKPPLPTDITDSDWSTTCSCSRGMCVDGAGGSSKTQRTTPPLQQPPAMPTFGGKSDRLSTYVTFQDEDVTGLYSVDTYEGDTGANIWCRSDTRDEAEVKRLLEMLQHDDCEDSVICDCSLPVGEDDPADLPAGPPCAADELQPSPFRPWAPLNVDDVSGKQPVFSNASHQTPPMSSSAADRDYDTSSGRCRTFQLPDVQVRLTSPQQSAASDRVVDPSAGAVTVVRPPDVINDPHYTVI